MSVLNLVCIFGATTKGDIILERLSSCGVTSMTYLTLHSAALGKADFAAIAG